MSSKKKAPAAPNPYDTAQAQGQMNESTARTQARLNRGNTVTPYGTVTNRDRGGEWLDDKLAWAAANDPNYQRDPDGARRFYEANNPYRDQWETTVALSPDQQRIYDQGVQLDTETGQLALDQMPAVRQLLSQPMATDDADARDRATAGIMSRLEPQFVRDREGLESRLVAQGFTPGSEGYRQAADELSRARTDARMQAVTAGLAESRAGATFANNQRAQRVNELGMLFGLGPGMQMPGQAELAGVGVNAPDLAGLIMQNYQMKMQDRQATNANWFGLAGAGARAAGAWAGRGGGGGPGQ